MSTLNSNQSPSSHPETRGNNNYKSTAKSANGENSKYDSDNNSQSRSNSGRRKPRTNNSNGNNGNNSNRSTNKPGQNNQLNRRPKNIANDSDDAYSKTTSAISETDSKANIDINCFICTEPIKIFAVGECEHRTCHVCSLRLRALYKNKHCAYCKTELTWVIFTEDPIREYSSFGDTEAACVDSSLGIRYQYQETFAESTRLLKFSCPKEGCTAVVSHWGKLKAHARDEHRLSFCDLCVKFKKAFPFEHRLFTRAQLRDHYRGVSRETSIGFRGHPECGFCHQDYYDDDQLYEHCRDRHEQCHLCVRSGTGRHQYYRNYKELEKHFHQDHFPCMYESCLESKFVVFSTDIDLKAHEHEVHGTAATGQRSLQRNARRIDIDIVYAHSPTQRQRGGQQQQQRGGGDYSRADRTGGNTSTMSRDNLHEDGYRSAPSTSTNTAATSRARITDESSSGSIVSTNSIGGGGDGGGGGGGTRRDRDSTETRRIRAPAGFGQLSEAPRTINTGPDANRDNQQQRSTTGANPQWPTLGNQPVIQQPKIDPSVKKWVEPLLDRFRSKFHNRTVKLVQLQMLLTDYFKHRITSKDFIDSVIQLTNDEFKQLTGKVVTAVIDQLENDNKRQELLTAWKDQQAVDKQFPDLQPSDFYTSSTLGRPGTGASSSTGAWNNAQSRKSGKQAAQTIEPDWGDSPSPWGKTAPTARYASASGGSAGPSALRSDSYRAKTTGSRTASDVVRNGMAPIVRKRDDDTADFPALPTVTRPPRPIVGKPVESEWLTGRPSATNASTGGNNTQPLKAKKGKGKGKTLLFHCG